MKKILKKIISFTCVAVLAFSMSTVSFAAETNADNSSTSTSQEDSVTITLQRETGGQFTLSEETRAASSVACQFYTSLFRSSGTDYYATWGTACVGDVLITTTGDMTVYAGNSITGDELYSQSIYTAFGTTDTFEIPASEKYITIQVSDINFYLTENGKQEANWDYEGYYEID